MKHISKFILLSTLLVCGLASLQDVVQQIRPRTVQDPPTGDLPVVGNIDLDRFSGIWYEIARIDYKGEKGCICSQQKIERLDRHGFLVNNTCHLRDPDGQMYTSVMRMDPQDDNKAKLSFEDQTEIWVIDLAQDYSWSLVGRPDRQHLWINARSLHLDQAIIDRLIQKAASLQFPKDKIIMDKQICGSNFLDL